MTEQEPEDTLTVKAVRDVLAEETFNLTKIAELRIKELTQLLVTYERKEITPDQASDRFTDYLKRWGDAVPHNMDPDSLMGLSDEQIIERIDEASGRRLASRVNKISGTKSR